MRLPGIPPYAANLCVLTTTNELLTTRGFDCASLKLATDLQLIDGANFILGEFHQKTVRLSPGDVNKSPEVELTGAT